MNQMKKVSHLKMTQSVVENRLKNAIRRLYYYDRKLMNNDVHERSIAHRLAVHLGIVFYEWDVDVEYNRNHGEVKRIYDHDEPSGRRVFPDIIRGCVPVTPRSLSKIGRDRESLSGSLFLFSHQT